jgi:photosystem II stability/assembly factor-like uncharacterized protein
MSNLQKLGSYLLTLLLSYLIFSALGCSTPAVSQENAGPQRPQPAAEAEQPSPTGRRNEAMIVHFVTEAAKPPGLLVEGSLINEQQAWVADGFDVKRTVDGGRTWQLVRPSDEDESVFGRRGDSYVLPSFITPTRGWLMAGSGTWQTADGGLTWQQIFPLQSSRPQFADGQHGWINVVMAGSRTRNHITADGGQTWQSCNKDLSDKGTTFTNNAYFLTPQLGWSIIRRALNRQAVNGVARTIDGGCSWKLIWTSDQNPDETYGDIFFLNEYEGWLAGSYLGTLLHTVNGGKTWHELRLPNKNVGVLKCLFDTSETGWIITALKSKTDTGVYHTENGGRNWHQLTVAEIRNNGHDSIPGNWKAGRLLRMLYAGGTK